MGRPKKVKTVGNEPSVVYFKPANVRLNQLQQVELNIEEIEAIRLSDVEDLKQKESAKLMDIHQSTFQRTLKNARQKLADAIIHGKSIKIQGGNFKMVEQSRGFGRGQGRNRNAGGFGLGPSGKCVCPKCGHEITHTRGTPCFQQKCPKCGTQMVRGN